MKNLIINLKLDFTICTEYSLVSEMERASFTKVVGYACFCSVHSLITATSNPNHLNALNNAKWLVSDGHPVAWLLRKLGYDQLRVSGPDIMHLYLSRDSLEKRVYLVGGSAVVCQSIINKYSKISPGIKFVGHSNEYIKDIKSDKNLFIVEAIKASNANSVWVGLGCPKQELWASYWFEKISAPVFAVGAAFDFLADKKSRAPKFMRDYSLEWLYRMAQEPKRLAGRYLVTNFKFIYSLFFNIYKHD